MLIVHHYVTLETAVFETHLLRHNKITCIQVHSMAIFMSLPQLSPLQSAPQHQHCHCHGCKLLALLLMLPGQYVLHDAPGTDSVYNVRCNFKHMCTLSTLLQEALTGRHSYSLHKRNNMTYFEVAIITDHCSFQQLCTNLIVDRSQFHILTITHRTHLRYCMKRQLDPFRGSVQSSFGTGNRAR